MYNRILRAELVVSAEEGGAGDAPNQATQLGAEPRRERPQRRASRAQGRRLAAAMGLTQLTLPFRRAPAQAASPHDHFHTHTHTHIYI
jgi:hypothetical protein